MTTRELHIKDKNIHLTASIIVISDSLSKVGEKKWQKLDTSGKKASELLLDQGIMIKKTVVVPDEIDSIQEIVNSEVNDQISLILTIGGTGISQRDITVEAIQPLLEKKLSGFGELFRSLTFKEVGTVSIMTRALAGVIKNSCVVSLPGSTNAVELGTNLIVKELLHIINLRR
ncbi:MAG: MogA/MoaB family molybdenum cofactor biosynthesis protein [Candidatus Hodarchaeales archaeon]|jgi:molybdenum cofactor biosynthesis protein B